METSLGFNGVTFSHGQERLFQLENLTVRSSIIFLGIMALAYGISWITFLISGYFLLHFAEVYIEPSIKSVNPWASRSFRSFAGIDPRSPDSPLIDSILAQLTAIVNEAVEKHGKENDESGPSKVPSSHLMMRISRKWQQNT